MSTPPGALDEGGIRVSVNVRPKRATADAGHKRTDQPEDPKAKKTAQQEDKAWQRYIAAREKFETKQESDATKSEGAAFHKLMKEVKSEKRKRKEAEDKFTKWFKQLDKATQAADKKAEQARKEWLRITKRYRPGTTGRRMPDDRTLPARGWGGVGATGKQKATVGALGIAEWESLMGTPESLAEQRRREAEADPQQLPEASPEANVRKIDRLAGGIAGFEAKAKALRTKTQRLQTYGLWFIETAQHNPAYTAGKFMLNTMRLLMPPYGAVFAGLIATIVSTSVVIPQTIRNMAKKGRPWNIDWHRAVSDEVVGMFSLEEQKRRDLGLHGVIADPTSGYQPVEGTEIYNNQTIADTVRLNKLTQEEKAGRLF